MQGILGDLARSGQNPGLLALVAEADKSAIPLLQELCSKAGIALTGAMFPSLIAGGQLTPHGIVLFVFDRMPTYWIVPELSKSRDQPEMGLKDLIEEITANAASKNHATLFMLFDGMLPNVGSILDALYLQLADQVDYLGANAGSETFQAMPCLFDNRVFVQDALLALLFDQQSSAALEHGYKPPQHIVSATASNGNRISSIDWRPAFEVYKQLMLSQHGVEITRENFYQYAVHYPFGIMRMDGGVLVRIPVALLEDGALLCVGEVPENAVLTLLQATKAGAGETISSLAAHLGPLRTENMLTFYCAGRRMHLGAGADEELAALQNKLAPSKLFGALSLGEIGSGLRHGYPLFHNAAIICAPWSNA